MARDSGRPRRTRRKPPKREITCGMALPAAAARTALALAQLVAVRWQSWGAR